MNLRSSTSTLILLFSFTTFLHAQFAPCESQWIESVSIQDVSCSGETDGSIAVLVDSSFFGNLSFVWSDNNIGDVSTASNLDAGNYGLTLSFGPNEGCVVSDSLFVSEPKPLNLECYEVPFIPFLPTNNRLIGVDIDGGTPPYLVVWSGPVNGQKDEPEMGETIISGLVSGDYSITVTDANGCAETCDTTLPCPVSINLKELNSPSCAEGNDGSISVALAGDWASVLWSTGDSTQTAGSLTAGTYSVTVTGSDGCTKSLENIELDEPNTLEVQIDTLIGDKSIIPNTG